MEQYHQNLIRVLKQHLSDNDINIVSENEGLLELSNPNMSDVTISAKYVMSSSVDWNIHGSKNNTPIDTIARFILPDLERNSLPKFFLFPVNNPKRGKSNFAVVPSQIFIERTYKRHHRDLIKKPLEVIFWLIPDNCLYDCTNISVEGEWFFLSKGINGRVADDTDWNYTPFLNNWQLLVDI